MISMEILQSETRPALEDLLAYLPCSKVIDVKKGGTLYEEGDLADSIYVVTEGMIKVSVMSDGSEVIIDLYRADDLIGESALLHPGTRAERATAIEYTKVMRWSVAEIEELMVRQPRLAAALVQAMTQRSLEYLEHITSFAAEKTSDRIVRALLRFEKRFGRPEEDGYVRLIPLPHGLLAKYVLTSRELVTVCMNELRAAGCLRYFRWAIFLRPDLLKEWSAKKQHNRRHLAAASAGVAAASAEFTSSGGLGKNEAEAGSS
jgi:CRP/FNR family transcriptional regulator